jgi:hypothetical protein
MALITMPHGEDLIPCELCNRDIPTSRYSRHLQRCLYALPRMLLFASWSGDLWNHNVRGGSGFLPQDPSYEDYLEMAEQVGKVLVPTRCIEAAIRPAPASDSDIQCPICLVHVCDCATVPCNHLFCHQCIRVWLESHHTCPICITDFNDATPSRQHTTTHRDTLCQFPGLPRAEAVSRIPE